MFLLRSSFLACLFTLVFAAPLLLAQSPRSVRIGVCFDGPGNLNAEVLAAVKVELDQLTDDEIDYSFPATLTLTGDWSVASIDNNLNILLSSKDIDLIVVLGAIGTHQVSHRGELRKPVIAPFAIDIDWQKLPFAGPGTGVRNLNYLVSLPDFQRGLASLQRIHKSDVVGIIVYQPYFNAIPVDSNRIELTETQFNCNLVHLPVGNTAESALQAIADSIDAVYVMPLIFGWDQAEISQLAERLVARKLPSFSYIGRNEVELGILAGLGQKMDWTRLARRVALSIQRIVSGEHAEDLPVDFSIESQLVINMETARQIGVYPNWDVMTEAELINERRDKSERVVTLSSAVVEALENNPDFMASEREVAAGAKNVNVARSNLLPQADVAAKYRLIDDDRAGGLGGMPEGQLLGTAQFSQLIFSDEAWAGVSIEKKLQIEREYSHEANRLDIILESAESFVDVLRALAVEQIQKNNLLVSKRNLELARLRERIGQSGPGEVYRWESQIATNRQDVVQANAKRNIAEIRLNRLLNHPEEEPFSVGQLDPAASLLLINDPRFRQYTDDRWSFSTYRSFMAEIAVELAPEMKQLDALIAAQERSRSASRRAMFVPTIGAKASLEYVLSEHGAGSGGENPLSVILPPGAVLEQPDDFNWTIGLEATLPLLEGGRRLAQIAQAGLEVQRLTYSQLSLRNRIQENTRSALHLFGAAHATVGFSKQAATAAANNLNLVSDAYSRGRADVLDLLDAQNAVLVADLVAANAEYDYVISYLRVQRAIGQFDIFLSNAERNERFARLEKFFEAARLNQ